MYYINYYFKHFLTSDFLFLKLLKSVNSKPWQIHHTQFFNAFHPSLIYVALYGSRIIPGKSKMPTIRYDSILSITFMKQTSVWGASSLYNFGDKFE